MGLFQKLFKRSDKGNKKETIKVEVDGDKADVADTTTTTTKGATKTPTPTTADTKQCAATTKAGTQCKRAPAGRSKFCSTHKN